MLFELDDYDKKELLKSAKLLNGGKSMICLVGLRT